MPTDIQRAMVQAREIVPAVVIYDAPDRNHRHFAFFQQRTGNYVREWKGPVDPPLVDSALSGDAREAALNRWATRVSYPELNEIGLDVTHIGWPVGDFCYCHFDEVERRLEFGLPRHYIEVRLDTLEIVANQESHRPIQDSVPGQRVIDITGTCLEPLHGHIFGRFVKRGHGWAIEPSPVVPIDVRLSLAEVPIDIIIPAGEKHEAYRDG